MLQSREYFAFSTDKTNNSLNSSRPYASHSTKMPVKRSRAGTSPPYLETPVSAAAPLSPVKVMKTDAAAETARSKLLAVASPVNVGGLADRSKIGEFLERCHYCNKRIAQNSDVFMYSNLCAFCSVECRDCQINQDRLAGKKP